MKTDLKKLESDFNSELQILLNNSNNNYLALELSQRYLHHIKSHIIESNFEVPQEEINCFKEIKPKLHSKLIYFKELLSIQQNLPLGSNEQKINYLNNHLNRFYLFFEENKSFIKYIRSELTNLDDQFFIRKNILSNQSYDINATEIDIRWNTGYDIILARYMAFEKLEVEINLRLYQINQSSYLSVQTTPKKRLHWTESKTSLVELIYALHATGSLNNGQTDIKTIAEILQAVFQIDLGDHYRIYYDLKTRKIHRTKFLNHLIEKLNQRMENGDI